MTHHQLHQLALRSVEAEIAKLETTRQEIMQSLRDLTDNDEARLNAQSHDLKKVKAKKGRGKNLAPSSPARKKITPAGRKKIAAAQRARWDRIRAEKEQAINSPAPAVPEA